MVLTQELRHLLRLSGFGKAGVTAQVAEHDDDLAAMAFEDLLVALRDDHFGELRREKSLQPPDPAQLLTWSAPRTSRPRFSSSTSSVRCRNSPKSRAFSIAITACAAKFSRSAICLSVKGLPSCR